MNRPGELEDRPVHEVSAWEEVRGVSGERCDDTSVSVRKEVESLESVVILCQAPALEVLYVDIEEPLPV